MACMSKKYLMKELPPPHDFKNRPIMFCSHNIQQNNVMVQARARYTSILPNNGLLTVMNDPIFDPVSFPVETCHLEATALLNQEAIRGNHVGSYVLDTNA